MKQTLCVNTALKLGLAGLMGLQVACSSDDPAVVTDDRTDAVISGSVVAAPVSGASVLLKDTAGNVVAGPVTTGNDGSYSTLISGAIPDTIIVESTGGTYSDEASGATTTAGMLMAYVDSSSMSAGGQIHATPASTIVSEMVMTHGVSLSDAQAAFESAFGFAVDTAIAPADATAPVAGATEEELLTGLRAAAFSQLTDDLSLAEAEQFDLLKALAADLAVGTLDGMDSGGAVAVTASVTLPSDIQNRFVIALLNFHDSGLTGMMADPATGNDQTGLLNNQIGILPFSKVAMADTYKVVYVPGVMDPMQGKSEFKLIISDAGAPVSTTVDLSLMMFMSDRMHSTPDLNCTEVGGTPGEYDCTVYYVMPGIDALGASRGYWQIQAMADAKSAVFYPTVMMAMGDTSRTLLKGQVGTDTISMMGVTTSRPYNLFRNDLNGTTGAHNFELFIAPMEMMTSFPPLTTGVTLNMGAFAVDDVKVEFSTDETNWFDANNVGVNGSGIWGITGLTGLSDGTEGNIYVKLSVDSDASGTFEASELKTTNGMAPDGTNEHQFFKVTP